MKSLHIVGHLTDKDDIDGLEWRVWPYGWWAVYQGTATFDDAQSWLYYKYHRFCWLHPGYWWHRLSKYRQLIYLFSQMVKVSGIRSAVKTFRIIMADMVQEYREGRAHL